ncbi:hypothetical protein ACFW5W_01690 [Streptomyces sp. NPDC058783]|uniref:hypothetical protein n=1 Tax=Streptomyces TaxID=1883 RepID=UPI00210E1D1A|nr:hypothetical protein [Streptomyces coelicoflavus]MCQ4205318.1 hypothetical protein [Streptomyces coelicoflavus]
MARHASPRTPHAQRALVVLATVGAAVAAGAATASAAEGGGDTIAGLAHTRPTSLGNIDPQAGVQAVTGVVGYVTGPVADLKPNPLAGTGVDPLDNGVGTKVADFQPLTSTALTGPVAQAQSLGAVPVVGQVTKLLR